MAVILAITILGTGLIGSYTTVPAAEFSAGAIAAGETLEWITAALAGAGISISVKELLKPRQAEIEKDIGKHIDWDNYDWGDALDSPAAQDQIDELDKTINKLYGNASAKWKEMYEKSLSPTPTPETSPDKPDPSPPVTVAPIDPDTVTPPGWDTLRKTSMKNGYLLLGTATYWCLKEAVKGLWDKLIGVGTTSDDSDLNKLDNTYYKHADVEGLTYVGKCYFLQKSSIGGTEYYRDLYSVGNNMICAIIMPYEGNFYRIMGVSKNYRTVWFRSYTNLYRYPNYTNKSNYTVKYDYSGDVSISNSTSNNCSNHMWSLNIPVYDLRGYSSSDYDTPEKLKAIIEGTSPKSEEKSKILPSTGLKNDYDNNKSPSLPDTLPDVPRRSPESSSGK